MRFIETESRWWVPGAGGEVWGVVFNGDRASII